MTTWFPLEKQNGLYYKQTRTTNNPERFLEKMKTLACAFVLATCVTGLFASSFYRGEITMQKEYKVSLYQINWGASPASEGSDRLQCEVSLDEESRKRISKITLIFEFYDMKKLVVSPMEVTYVYPVIPLIRESPIWIHADFPRVKDAVYMRLANVVFDDKEEVHVRLKSNISNKMMRNSFKLPTGKDSRPASFSTQTKWIQQKAAETPGNVDVETLGIPRPIRTWTARSGHKIEAALQKTEQETVFLTGADGNTLKVPIAALSGADADYISSQRPSSRK